MTTRMMLPIIDSIDAAGFEAFELISSAFFKKAVRDLKEDLWERTRLVAQRAKKTPLRAIRSRSMLAFQITPIAISELWLERLAANGITELRTSDPSNTPSYWAESWPAPIGWASKQFSILSIRYRRNTPTIISFREFAKPPNSTWRASALKIREDCSPQSEPARWFH
jgi:hypothetical protein